MGLAPVADFAGLLAWRERALDGVSLNQETSELAWSALAAFPQRDGLQWPTNEIPALQSRGGDGVAPSSRARSPR